MAKLQNNLEYKVSHDELTNIFNRRYIKERLQEELSKVKRNKQKNNNYSSSIILIDIDHFKLVNDTHGPILGDEILISFSKHINSLIRKEDVFGRFEGEEFLAVLPMTSLPQALEFAQRICDSIKNNPFKVGNTEYSLTASLGVSHLMHTDKSIDECFFRADKVLYYVKENG